MNKHELEKGEITGRILKCAVEVHRTLGPGFQEVVYQRALARELEAEGLLKASGYRVALLLNFGTQRLQSKRLVYG